ncbi:hypothetical protein PSU4_20600 [Pseudonocardia sulfidoxydans NBRC 16205]|uniref:Uncharacterized protein n=1 Tax=Pseudonocardia sulfidoxydans NBRC 16205 TaxID=1223511 RepID=A0A511DEA4_9PSEU|nr:hypothetical protein PSU4_20600 [Pseudonocardia sulfidoxydans NBRC 16205]
MSFGSDDTGALWFDGLEYDVVARVITPFGLAVSAAIADPAVATAPSVSSAATPPVTSVFFIIVLLRPFRSPGLSGRR